MAKLYFYYGAMGSSKSANAMMVAFNYRERGQKVLLCKTGVDTRDGARVIKSRMGLESKCELLDEICHWDKEKLGSYNVVIVDEAQFATSEQIDFLSDIVDDLHVPVICYGLRADFQNHLFPGSQRLLEICDEINEVKTMCWCGHKAICNARYNADGIVREGAQVMLGANDEYIALCRKHFKEGKLHPDQEVVGLTD
ncbi:thymidine kinase [Bulleidia sp. HCP3S3_F2]|jgi:thymidine kinase|uniref:thymidine kinase n=1 Tax=unclassified Bulleidia TaxID=2704656 RepID=UPI002A86791E|nr:thymidine kinase [Bulleidia sp.]